MIFSCVLYQGEDVPAHSKGIFTPEWADRLYRGIKRNYSKPFRFVVYTDQDYEFAEPVEQRRLVLPYKNMFSLLEPFRETEGRQVFMGLDTIITGNLDFLDQYHGFWMLRDPYFDRPCSGVMVFDPQPHIWADIEANHEAYTKEATMFGYPSDMILLNRYTPQIIDGVNVGIKSYKAHIAGRGLRDARIVYFHGEWKPHQLPELGWVGEHWGPPLLRKAEYIETLNNSPETLMANTLANMQNGVPWMVPSPPHNRTAIICGGGPSLAEGLKTLRSLRGKKSDIFALNGVHDYLLGVNIKPDYHVILDSRPENVAFLKTPRKGIKYYISAQCDASLFDAVEGFDRTLWFVNLDGLKEEILKDVTLRPIVLVGGGNTVGCKSLFLAWYMGYRSFEIFGFDSCYRDGQNHAYRQSMNDGEPVNEIIAGGRRFWAAPWMAKQAEWFQKHAIELAKEGCSIRVHGDGLISWMIKHGNEVANG